MLLLQKVGGFGSFGGRGREGMGWLSNEAELLRILLLAIIISLILVGIILVANPKSYQ